MSGETSTILQVTLLTARLLPVTVAWTLNDVVVGTTLQRYVFGLALIVQQSLLSLQIGKFWSGHHLAAYLAMQLSSGKKDSLQRVKAHIWSIIEVVMDDSSLNFVHDILFFLGCDTLSENFIQLNAFISLYHLYFSSHIMQSILSSS